MTPFESAINEAAEQPLYYIVSLHRTSKADTALALWGHNRSGYTYNKTSAGLYTETEVNTIRMRNIDNVPVLASEADKLFLPADDHNDHFIALPNNKTVRTILGLSNLSMKAAKYKTCKMIFRKFKTGENA